MSAKSATWHIHLVHLLLFFLDENQFHYLSAW